MDIDFFGVFLQISLVFFLLFFTYLDIIYASFKVNELPKGNTLQYLALYNVVHRLVPESLVADYVHVKNSWDSQAPTSGITNKMVDISNPRDFLV